MPPYCNYPIIGPFIELPAVALLLAAVVSIGMLFIMGKALGDAMTEDPFKWITFILAAVFALSVVALVLRWFCP